MGSSPTIKHGEVLELAEKVIVYTTQGCGYSDMLADQLRSEGKEWVEVNLSLHPDRWAEVLPLTDGDNCT